MLYVWYPKNRTDLNVIHKENNVIEMQEELANAKKKLTQGKHTCLIMRMEHPRAYEIFSESRNSLLQDSCQHSYQEMATLLSRDLSTLNQEISALLSRD